jgi:hypothetical protein
MPMRVRMLRHISGARNGVEWPPAGGEVDLPDHEAEGLVANGYAEPADEEAHDETPAEDTGGSAADPPGPDGPSSGADAAATGGSDDPEAGDPGEAADLDALRAKYRDVTGTDPDSRWRATRLRKELDGARAGD